MIILFLCLLVATATGRATAPAPGTCTSPVALVLLVKPGEVPCTLHKCSGDILTPPLASPPQAVRDTPRKLIELLLTAIELILEFYEENFVKIAAASRKDGTFGLVVLKRQLDDFFAEAECDAEKYRRLKNIQRRVNVLLPAIFEASLEDLKVKDGATVRKLRAVLSPSLYTTPRPTANVKAAEDRLIGWLNRTKDRSRIGHEEEVIDPALNFECLSAMAEMPCGTLDDTSTECDEAYLGDPASQYMLTHQVLYAHMVRTRVTMCEGRTRVLERRLDYLCAKVYAEAEYLAERGFPLRFRDLFSEQVMLCGLAGYPNFFRSDWLHEILSWQNAGRVGCYAHVGKEYTEHGGCSDVLIPVGDTQCLLHMTTVSLGALAVNLKHFATSSLQNS